MGCAAGYHFGLRRRRLNRLDTQLPMGEAHHHLTYVHCPELHVSAVSAADGAEEAVGVRRARHPDPSRQLTGEGHYMLSCGLPSLLTCYTFAARSRWHTIVDNCSSSPIWRGCWGLVLSGGDKATVCNVAWWPARTHVVYQSTAIDPSGNTASGHHRCMSVGCCCAAG